MSTDALLSISGLYKAFGGVAATNQVTLDFNEGEVHAIIGPTAPVKQRWSPN